MSETPDAPSLTASTRPSLPLLDHGYLTLIESWGSDERIIEAARQSTSGAFRGWGTGHAEECPQKDTSLTSSPCARCGASSGDEKLLAYLYTHKHMTPFEMAGLTIEVQAPIFVFREWHRHRTQSYNEMSSRYTVLPDLSYLPSEDRMMRSKQSQTNKQGSQEGFGHAHAVRLRAAMEASQKEARILYENLLREGVSREIARLVLPVTQYSRMRASANLRNWLGFLTLRTAPDAQEEIRVYANALATLIEEAFPRTFSLWNSAQN